MKGTILLIDDNTLLMELNREALVQRGYRVLEAESISRGKALFESESPDLIMMETVLPDGCGLKLCAEMRSRSKKAPVMFVSMQATEKDELAGYDAGGSVYVKKPYTMRMLMVRMEGLLRFVRRMQEDNLEKHLINQRKFREDVIND